jgi:hypothetical protein
MKILESLYVCLPTTAYMRAKKSEQSIWLLIAMIMSKQIYEYLDFLSLVCTCIHTYVLFTVLCLCFVLLSHAHSVYLRILSLLQLMVMDRQHVHIRYVCSLCFWVMWSPIECQIRQVALCVYLHSSTYVLAVFAVLPTSLHYKLFPHPLNQFSAWKKINVIKIIVWLI